ncbi:MAG: hypothetical protein ACRD2X_00125 [Vicinamibacteraceae bacterium]
MLRTLFGTFTPGLAALALVLGMVPDAKGESAPTIHAKVSDDHVYVEFVGASNPIAIVDERLSRSESVSLTWIVELRRITRNWRNRKIVEATLVR